MARDSESWRWAATSARSLLATCLRNTSVRHIFSLDGCNHKYIAPRQAEGKRARSIVAHRKNGLCPGLPQSAVLEHIDSRELRSIPESRVIDVEVIAMSEDMQGLGGGTGPLMFRMPCAPGEEMECIGDGKGDCLMAGRVIPAVDTEPVSTVNAPPSPATYPWPSMKRRYGSPSCRSMSYWARAMGTSDVPTLYGLEKVSVEELVGKPTVKVVSASGNVFYMTQVHSAIAKVSELLQCDDDSLLVPERFFYSSLREAFSSAASSMRYPMQTV
ncbi:hypothetical protein PYCCODRAFT_1429041 [Trametes coccinea BRFM310]|uniref:Uncharacterized protein n=1 Tax=Trametes coccinea (strain BRFM310) TaxID=1353009 RepID=A0A1Y2I5Z1_TRAC3|nr:hypothetical protein PYCCODRAFT_1429041 [Trametes coccinea BRFM310]